MTSELSLLSQYLNDIALEKSGIFKVCPRRFVILDTPISDSVSDIDSNLTSARMAEYTTDINGLDSEEKKWQAIKNASLENIIKNNSDDYVFGGEIVFLSEIAGVGDAHFFHEIVLSGSEIVKYSIDSEAIEDPSETIFRISNNDTNNDTDPEFTQIAILYDVNLVSDGIEMVSVASDILMGIITLSESLIGTNWTIRVLLGADGASTVTIGTENDADYQEVIKNLMGCARVAGKIISLRPDVLDDIKAEIAEIKNNSKENVPYLRNDGWYVNGSFVCPAIFGSCAIQLRELLGDLNENWEVLSDFMANYESWSELIGLITENELNEAILSNLENILLGENVVAFNAVTVLTESDPDTNNTILTISVPYQFTAVAVDSEIITADSEIDSFNLEIDSNLDITVSELGEIMIGLSDEFIESIAVNEITGGGIVTVTQIDNDNDSDSTTDSDSTHENHEYLISAYAFDTIFINDTSTIINAYDEDYIENAVLFISLDDNLLIDLSQPRYNTLDDTNFYYEIIFSFSEECVSILNTAYTAKDAIEFTNEESNTIISTPFAFRKIEYNDIIVYTAQDSDSAIINLNSENLVVTINDYNIDITMAPIPLNGTGISGDLYEYGIDDAIETYFNNMDNYTIFSVFVITSNHNTRYVWWHGAGSATEIYNVDGGFFSEPDNWGDTDNITWSNDATDFKNYSSSDYDFTIFYYEEENFFLLRVGHTQNNATTYTYYMNWKNIPEDASGDGYLRDSDYFNIITANTNNGTVTEIEANTDILFHYGYYVYQWNDDNETFESVSYLSDASAPEYSSMPDESDLEFTYKFLGDDVWK